MEPNVQQIASIRTKAAAARAAHEAVNRALAAGLRSQDPKAYDQLLMEFRALTSAAMPGICMADVASGNRPAINRAIAFLAADPYFFRSGYVKTALLRKLKKAALSDDQKSALADQVLERVTQHGRSNRRQYGRLAAAMKWPPLDRQLVALLESPQQEVRQRALSMLQQIMSARAIPGE